MKPALKLRIYNCWGTKTARPRRFIHM